jgi:hypothetical protein
VARKIVKGAMKKARRQLAPRAHGLLAVCGYNVSATTSENLKQVLADRLQRTARPYLLGVALVTLGVLLNAEGESWSFSPTLTVSFVPNRSYFGTVDVETATPGHRLPQRIKTPLVDLTTDELLSENASPVDSTAAHVFPEQREQQRSQIRARRLGIIQEPAPLTRSVVRGSGKEIRPLFVGQGDLNCLCGKCGINLAKSVWDASVGNVVVECPGCRAYNEFPPLAETGRYTIQLTEGGHNFSGPVRLRKAVSVLGH